MEQHLADSIALSVPAFYDEDVTRHAHARTHAPKRFPPPLPCLQYSVSDRGFDCACRLSYWGVMSPSLLAHRPDLFGCCDPATTDLLDRRHVLHSPCSKCRLPSNMTALITSDLRDRRHVRPGEQLLTAAIPMDNPYCSCKLTREPQSSRSALVELLVLPPALHTNQPQVLHTSTGTFTDTTCLNAKVFLAPEYTAEGSMRPEQLAAALPVSRRLVDRGSPADPPLPGRAGLLTEDPQ